MIILIFVLHCSSDKSCEPSFSRTIAQACVLPVRMVPHPKAAALAAAQ